MSQNIGVNFKINGGELASYIDTIQKKSTQLTNDAVKGALEQSKAGREQLAIINQQIAAIERKTRIETQAARSIALEQRELALGKNRDVFEGRKNDVFADSRLSEKDKKERVTALSGMEYAFSDKIKADYKDNLTILREQERQSKLQTALARENVDTLKQTARENVSAIVRGDKKLEDIISVASTEEEKLVARLTEEGLNKEKRKDTREREKESVFGTLLKTDLLRSAGGMIGQIPNAKSELDFIKPMTSMLGMAIGGALGSAIDLVTGTKILGTGVGQTQAGVIGAEMGKVAGEFIGSSLERAYQGRENLTTKNFAIQALTGINYGVDAFGSQNNGLGSTGRSRLTGNLSKYGLDYSQTADLEFQIAQRQGNSRNLYSGAENTIALEKGLGLSRDAIFSVIEMQRSSAMENRDVLRSVSGILNAGKNSIFKDDRTFLSEFTGKFTTLQRELLKTQGQVATGTTMDILMKFNSIGGQFDARDPRSMGLINSVNNSLINPNTDFKKSLSFYALRQQMGAGASIADVLQEQQKGLGSESYRNAIFKLYSSFGDDSSKRLAFADLVGGNVDSGTRLLRAYESGKLKNGEFFGRELRGGMSERDIRGLAEGQVGQYAKSTAEIENMFIDDVSKAVTGVGDRMKVLFGSMMEELEDWIVNKIKGNSNTSSKVFTNNRQLPSTVKNFENPWTIYPSTIK